MNLQVYLFLYLEKMESCFKSLNDRLKLEEPNNARRLPENVLATMTYSVVRALDYLRQINILHRDIKPSNILVSSSSGKTL